MRPAIFLLAIHCLGLLPVKGRAQGKDSLITVDCQSSKGRLRPLQGVNGGVLVRREYINLSSSWDEIGVPIARLHDMPWCSDEVVDIHTIFPDLSKDAGMQENYRFPLTDDFIQPIVTGKMELNADLPPGENPKTEIIYRLGESIEHSRRKTYVHPPADFNKWADVCVGIIRHYNEGWARGFHDKIRYWEIWNEAENQHPPSQWTGTSDEYYKLYAITARKLKAAFPGLKIGGPASGIQGEFTEDRFVPSKYAEGFMKACVEQKLPLDFFSWHTYTDNPALYRHKAILLRKWLDQNGYRNTELHLNEWNYAPPSLPSEPQEKWFDRMGGVEGAAFSAYVLLSLQGSPVDVANYYSGDVNPYGMFSAQAGGPKKVFYAFKAFRFLLNTPVIIDTLPIVPGKSIAVIARNEENTEITVMLANFNHPHAEIGLRLTNLPWKGGASLSRWLVDDTHHFEPVETQELGAGSILLKLSPGPYSVSVIRLKSL